VCGVFLESFHCSSNIKADHVSGCVDGAAAISNCVFVYVLLDGDFLAGELFF
jgi:hypothetical protein